MATLQNKVSLRRVQGSLMRHLGGVGSEWRAGYPDVALSSVFAQVIEGSDTGSGGLGGGWDRDAAVADELAGEGGGVADSGGVDAEEGADGVLGQAEVAAEAEGEHVVGEGEPGAGVRAAVADGVDALAVAVAVAAGADGVVVLRAVGA